LLFEISMVCMFFILGAGFVLLALGFGALVRPRRLRKERNETYECGLEPLGHAWYNFNPRFYMLALIFLIFDVEIVISYPVFTVLKTWAARGEGLLAFFEILLFVIILAAGLVFLWVRGDLEWIKKIELTSGPEEMK
jgi:NADH-quinone oxidoreductase subunit A